MHYSIRIFSDRNLSENKLSGKIPDSINNLENLEEL